MKPIALLSVVVILAIFEHAKQFDVLFDLISYSVCLSDAK